MSGTTSRCLLQKLINFVQGKCVDTTADSPMVQEILTSGHLIAILLRVSFKLVNF